MAQVNYLEKMTFTGFTVDRKRADLLINEQDIQSLMKRHYLHLLH